MQAKVSVKEYACILALFFKKECRQFLRRYIEDIGKSSAKPIRDNFFWKFYSFIFGGSENIE